MSGMVLIASEWDVDQELPPNSSRNAIPRICHERVPTHDVVWSELLTGSGTYGGARVTALAARVIKESTARAAACSIAGSVPLAERPRLSPELKAAVGLQSRGGP